MYPDCVRELRQGIYVDDINLGATSVKETKQLKDYTIEIFKDGGFTLHKWHSNVKELEEGIVKEDETSFAKESLGTKQSEVKLLGVEWNKDEDTIAVISPFQNSFECLCDHVKKRSPGTKHRKMIYRNAGKIGQRIFQRNSILQDLLLSERVK